MNWTGVDLDAYRRRPKILIVLHQETSTPGRVGQMLEARGYALDIRRPPLGDALPDTMSDHEGAVMFGGPMSANDDEDYLTIETDWIDVPLRENKPFFGICLGAQMLVNHLGGKVRPDPDCHAEVGYYPIQPTELGASLMRWPEMVYQWHREGVELPSGVELLATGNNRFPNQAFRYGENAYAVQFHSELTYAMMRRWIVRGAERMNLPGTQQPPQHIEGRMLYDAPIRDWLSDFLDLWLGERVAANAKIESETDAETILRENA